MSFRVPSLGVQAEKKEAVLVSPFFFPESRDGYDVVTSELRPVLLYPVLNEQARRQMNEPLFSLFFLFYYCNLYFY
jgi:hypothetical protein